MEKVHKDEIMNRPEFAFADMLLKKYIDVTAKALKDNAEYNSVENNANLPSFENPQNWPGTTKLRIPNFFTLQKTSFF